MATRTLFDEHAVDELLLTVHRSRFAAGRAARHLLVSKQSLAAHPALLRNAVFSFNFGFIERLRSGQTPLHGSMGYVWATPPNYRDPIDVFTQAAYEESFTPRGLLRLRTEASRRAPRTDMLPNNGIFSPRVHTRKAVRHASSQRRSPISLFGRRCRTGRHINGVSASDADAPPRAVKLRRVGSVDAARLWQHFLPWACACRTLDGSTVSSASQPYYEPGAHAFSSPIQATHTFRKRTFARGGGNGFGRRRGRRTRRTGRIGVPLNGSDTLTFRSASSAHEGRPPRLALVAQGAEAGSHSERK